MSVPASADETPHAIRASLIAAATGEPLAEVILRDKLIVHPWPYVGELPADLDPVNAEFGESAEISLAGTNALPAALNSGDPLNLTLYWQAHTDITEAYHVFLHLIAEDGSISGAVGQRTRSRISTHRKLA